MEEKILPPEHWKNLSLVDIDGEVWMDIVGYEGLYRVSNMGRVFIVKKGVMMTLKNNKGYKYVFLSKNDKKKQCAVYRLVAQHFIPNPNNLPEVNHKWGIIWDNRASELEWMTHGNNMRHSYIMVLNNNFKISIEQANEIRAKYLTYDYSFAFLAKEYNVSRSLIFQIIRYNHRLFENQLPK
jgi:hypothetical protein